MSPELAGKVYGILVDHCGASDDEYERTSFVHAHRNVWPSYPCREWRFQGSLGFGGKFWSDYLRVSCYPEDETPERLASIAAANAALSQLAASQ